LRRHESIYHAISRLKCLSALESIKIGEQLISVTPDTARPTRFPLSGTKPTLRNVRWPVAF
jgi:hypothetical protein